MLFVFTEHLIFTVPLSFLRIAVAVAAPASPAAVMVRQIRGGNEMAKCAYERATGFLLLQYFSLGEGEMLLNIELKSVKFFSKKGRILKIFNLQLRTTCF